MTHPHTAATRLFDTVTDLLKILFDREDVQIKKRQQAMIAKHAQTGGSTDGFRHMGLIYSDLTGYARQKGAYGRLHPSLLNEMDAILADQKMVAADRDRIKQALGIVLRDCRSFQDMRDALPNCMRDLIPECRNLERTREEAFTLVDNRRSYTQYMALREKIEFYVASRLLY
jgi:hypothetical protein